LEKKAGPAHLKTATKYTNAIPPLQGSWIPSHCSFLTAGYANPGFRSDSQLPPVQLTCMPTICAMTLLVPSAEDPHEKQAKRRQVELKKLVFKS